MSQRWNAEYIKLWWRLKEVRGYAFLALEETQWTQHSEGGLTFGDLLVGIVRR